MANVHKELGWLEWVSPVHDTYPFIDASRADLSGRSVLITGASKGIGLTTASHFAKAGCSKIALAARSSLKEAAAAVRKAAKDAKHPEPQVLELTMDVTSVESVRAAAQQVDKAFGGSLDALVNNAGYLSPFSLTGESDPVEWWKTWEVNINGSYLPCRYFLPMLLKSQLKTIINLSSVGGHMLMPAAAAYQTTKFAVCRFTELLAVEYGDQGLVAYALHPGGVKTELALQMPESMHARLIDEPELAADTMVWLCKEKRDWLSGRYLPATWNLEEVEARKKEIVEKDLLKFRMTI